jgi:hypothetical protein
MELDPSTRRLYLAVREQTNTDAGKRHRATAAPASLAILVYAR